MVRLAWMTDIHLNFLSGVQVDAWLKSIAKQPFDALLITGDVGEAKSFATYLTKIAGSLSRPIYFILGNHDYYRGTIDGVRLAADQLAQDHSLLTWLTQRGIVRLSNESALIGHGGWADGGYGDFRRSTIMLNDYVLIRDLADLTTDERFARLQALGAETAVYLQNTLPLALDQYHHVYVALHAPPFQEACWYEGQTPDDDDPYLPHFTCKQAGDALLTIAEQYPLRQITVLCGHTHGSGEACPRPNLRVITGGAEYGVPRIDRIIST